MLLVESNLVLRPSLAASCQVKVTDPLTILTAASMTLDPTTSERGRGDVGCTGGELTQSTQMALGTSESGWTTSTSQNAVMARRPLTYQKKRHKSF